MDDAITRIVMDSLKEAAIDLVVTLPEEPTSSLTNATRRDPYFTTVNVAGESSGMALCAGAALSGRDCVFVTGVAGMLVGSWALAQMGMVYGAPFMILASYRGDFGDHTAIPGSQLLMFKQVLEPHLKTLHIPYQIVDRTADIEKSIQRAHFACRDYETPVALLLTGEVLW
jgi:sulfopyruvate decarboxylase TPP-binding subunit